MIKGTTYIRMPLLLVLLSCLALQSHLTHASSPKYDDTSAAPVFLEIHTEVSKLCKGYDSCISCTQSGICGWCSSEKRCLPGNAEQPSRGRGRRSKCLRHPEAWHFEEGSCGGNNFRTKNSEALTPDIVAMGEGLGILELLPGLDKYLPNFPKENVSEHHHHHHHHNHTHNQTHHHHHGKHHKNETTDIYQCEHNDTHCQLNAAKYHLVQKQEALASLHDELKHARKELWKAEKTFQLINETISHPNSTNTTIHSVADARAAAKKAKVLEQEAKDRQEKADHAAKAAEKALAKLQKEEAARQKKEASDKLAAAQKAKAQAEKAVAEAHALHKNNKASFIELETLPRLLSVRKRS